MEVRQKAFAYITQGSKLLVFDHVDAPEAGIQVPAGSIETGESPEQAAIREAHEETGLQNLTMLRFLGEQIQDMSEWGKSEVHHRHFFHLICEEETPVTWQHGERFPSDDPDHTGGFKHLFQLYWVEISQLPKLIANHDYYVWKL